MWKNLYTTVAKQYTGDIVKVAILIKRSFPEFPRVIPLDKKVVFISRVYTEPPSKEEKEGWANWTEENKPYYKFKYTTRYGQRIVFIIPKNIELTVEEFAKSVEKKNWFKALKKWATPGYEEFETDCNLAEQLIEKIYTLLTKREVFCCGEAVKKWLSEIPEKIKNMNGLEDVDSAGVYFKFKKEFNYDVLPFTVSVEIFMPWGEFAEILPIYPTVRDYARLILEIMEKTRYVDIRDLPEKRENLVKHLGIVIERLQKRSNLRADFREKIILWLKYLRHFYLPVD